MKYSKDEILPYIPCKPEVEYVRKPRNKTYQNKLKDPRWQKKRLLILERDSWECQRCGSIDKTLHVHHKIYNKRKPPWEIEDKNLITYCAECHKLEMSNG